MKGLTKRYPLQPRVSYTRLKPGEDRTNQKPAGMLPHADHQRTGPATAMAGPERITEMNPKHHISVHPETRHNGDGEGPLVFHFIPKEKTSPDGWKAICGAFVRDGAGCVHAGPATDPELPDVGASSSVICPLCALALQLGEDRRDAPHWTSRYKTADRFITELTIINKLGKEQQ